MSAHTPSPWTFVQSGTGDFPIWNVRIGTKGLITLPATAGMETMDADARLIAAAPELLEALQDLCDTLGECGMTEKARAAISKATGETT